MTRPGKITAAAVNTAVDHENITEIDVRGFRCPLPVLKAAKRMSALPTGTRVAILATDPMSAIDVPHFCNENGHRLVEQAAQDGVWRFIVDKGADSERDATGPKSNT